MNRTLLMIFVVLLSASVRADELERLNQEIKTDNFAKESLNTWQNILAGSAYPELRNQAPHALLKIQPSRLQARLLSQAYFKSKDNHDFRFAILHELVKTKMVTVMEGWQKEVMSSEYTYDERLNLNYLSRRDGALKILYKESTLVSQSSCEFDKKKLRMELRTKEKEKEYLWLISGFHIYFTGIELKAAQENLPNCNEIAFLKFSRSQGGLFWEKSGGHLLTFEDRYLRPISYLAFKDKSEFSRLSKIDGNKACFISEAQNLYPVSKNWLCSK